MGSRASYVIDDVSDPVLVCGAVFDVLDEDVQTVRIDAYSDYADQMPADIRGAEAWLRQRGLLGEDHDPATAITITRHDDVGWAIGRAYALWSTRVRLLNDAGTPIATLDDGARAVVVELTDGERGRLSERIGRAATISRVSPGDG